MKAASARTQGNRRFADIRSLDELADRLDGPDTGPLASADDVHATRVARWMLGTLGASGVELGGDRTAKLAARLSQLAEVERRRS